MADVKISGLPASTVPLAGTEVLPIVQGGATKKVASDDLTVKNIRSNATNGVLQVAGPAAAATRVMTTPDANFTVARIDAAQSFTGDQTLSTGNLVIGTAGKGIDFSATTGTGTSELLADYEEGTWTPEVTSNSGTITTYASGGYYTKVGNTVNIQGYAELIDVGTAAGSMGLTLPFTVKTVAASLRNFFVGGVRESGATGNAFLIRAAGGGSVANIQGLSTGVIVWTNGYIYPFSLTYQAST